MSDVIDAISKELRDKAERIAELEAALRVAERRNEGLKYMIDQAKIDAQETAEMQWQPIETAPKDATSILVMDNDQLWPGGEADDCWSGNTAVAEWWGEGSGWICYMDAPENPPLHFEPTHWMPLPQRPA